MAQDNIYRSPYPIVYVYAIEDERHKDALKIGKASIMLSRKDLDTIDPTGDEVIKAAKECIATQVNRAAVSAVFKYAELGFYRDEDGEEHPIWDKWVHRVLEQNGFEKKDFPDMDGNPQEWYICKLEDVKDAIRTIKSGHNVMPRNNKTGKSIIKFRKEQEEAINETIAQFSVGNQMLWNAKMRFGKTLCSLELIRRQKYNKTLIVTHRPSVRSGWFDDYGQLPFNGYAYGCKLAETGSDQNVGETFATLQRDYKRNRTKYIYFASMQDLRGGSDAKEGGIDKNHEIFQDDWDLIIVDEAHEGTQTALGKNVLDMLVKKKPKVLYLSGTPYNILHLFTAKEIFTWDYNMEQEAKERWYEEHPGEPNDYADLPRLNIRTFRLRDSFERFYDFEEDYFNFAELFRTWTGDDKKDGAQIPSPGHVGRFVNENDIRAFLDLMHQPHSQYPFSTEEYRELFAHTFWLVPGVKEAKALSALLQEKNSWWQDAEHRFHIVNVAGKGDDPAHDRNETKKQVEDREKKEKDALEKVKAAIAKYPRTITISCGRLTTGVTVKPWTGVFMLKGNGDTKAATYMQTIFRAQSPCKEPFKTECYAFDFAPDRTLTVIDEYLSSQPESRNQPKRPKETVITQFLTFCSIISIDGGSTVQFDTKEFITQVNRAYKECIIKKGFKGRQLYVDLYQLSDTDKALLEQVEGVLKGSKSRDNDGRISVTSGGTKQTGTEKQRTQTKKKGNDEGSTERKKLRDRYQAILDTLSIRLPMMIFGEVESIEHFDLNRFVDSIHDESWSVFMPKGITRELFKSLLHLYNTDAILASFEGILQETHNADALPVAERAKKIAELLATFRFPDKETVLTPWDVVNLHMATTIGGYDFYDETHKIQLSEPRFAPQEKITDGIFADAHSHILEINAKSGVYPLWLAYTYFRYREKDYEKQHGRLPNEAEQVDVWQTILRENIFVLCMSPMAVKITERALRGYHDYQTNCKYQPKLLEILKDDANQKDLVKQIKEYSYWGNKNMEANKFEFKAVVGNPPYQGQSSAQLYPHFYLLSRELGKYSSLIFPTGWQKPCAPTAKGLARLNKEEIKADPQIHYINILHNVFPGVSGAAEVNVVFWERNFDNGLKGCQKILMDGQNPDTIQLKWEQENADKPQEIKVLAGIVSHHPNFVSLKDSISSRTPFGLESDAFVDVAKYGLPPIVDETPQKKDDIKIYGGLGRSGKAIRYVRRNYPLPKKPRTFDKYKVLVPCAWGNMSNVGLGGSFGNIIVAKPYEICTKTYTTSGCFDDINQAYKHAKYLMTKFVRALLFLNKFGIQASHVAFAAVPLQDYNESWWNESVEQINKHLFEKYNIPQPIRDYVNSHIQPRSEENIQNLQ